MRTAPSSSALPGHRRRSSWTARKIGQVGGVLQVFIYPCWPTLRWQPDRARREGAGAGAGESKR
eukprot:5840090-Lingulodinium_polyedra.AAC.1